MLCRAVIRPAKVNDFSREKRSDIKKERKKERDEREKERSSIQMAKTEKDKWSSQEKTERNRNITAVKKRIPSLTFLLCLFCARFTFF